MRDLYERQEDIDRVTVVQELIKHEHLESVDGMGYLLSLEDGMPHLVSLEPWVRIVKELADKRRLILVSQRLMRQALENNTSTSEELAAEATQALLNFTHYDEKSCLERVPDIIRQLPNGIKDLITASARSRGVATGFARFDDMTGGFRNGELIIIAGRPSMGKTALATNIADNVALCAQKKSVALFSLEMSKEDYVRRLLCGRARVDLNKARAGHLNAEERQRMLNAYNEYDDSKLWIDDTGGTTVVDIHSKLRRLKQQNGLDLVIIDYLQLIGGHKKSQTRDAEIGQITRYAKIILAKELNIPIIMLSQLNRGPETRPGDHRPQMSDLRDSGNIEQDADLIAFVYRGEVYKPDQEDLRGLAELHVAKQRNGPTGRVNLTFLKEFACFGERATHSD
jgi:replicative DNA helicase